MDRVLARADNQGKPIIFAADSLSRKSKNILAWRPGQEPWNVSLDFYHACTPLAETESEKIVKAYSKAWDQPEIQVMQRLPRLVGAKPKFAQRKQEATVEAVKPVEAKPEIVATDAVKPPQQAFVMRKHENFWRVSDMEGNTQAYVTDETAALAVLKDLLGNQTTFQH